MATISNTPRPGYVWDATDNVWYPIGVGGHGHPDYITQATAVNPTIIDAKGDIITATAADTPARLAVGNNGETLVADSSTSTGLRYTGNYAAGKNAIINGDYRVWQRGTSFTPTANAYNSDRWIFDVNSGSVGTGTITQQTFTPGTAPVAGYEGQYFWRYNLTATGTSVNHYHGTKLEDVRLFAGQTVTLSFYGKADSARTITSEILQIFGSGGSSGVITAGAAHSFTTAWQRFTVTIAVPSISGKTIGTNSYLFPRFYWTAAAGVTIDTWGWQLEAGSVATAFQTATGTIQGELAACQRYYFLLASGTSRMVGSANAFSATQVGIVANLPVQMRTDPTVVATSGTDYYSFYRNGGSDLFNSVTLGTPNGTVVELYNNGQISSTAGNAGICLTNNASASIAFSAEL